MSINKKAMLTQTTTDPYVKWSLADVGHKCGLSEQCFYTYCTSSIWQMSSCTCDSHRAATQIS